jgi:formylglycine-generating enzyme required for sulfatase activity
MSISGLSRRHFLAASARFGTVLVLGDFAPGAVPEPSKLFPGLAGDSGRAPDLIPAPRHPAEWPAWRAALAQWRARARQGLSYDDALYRRPDFAWVRTDFSCCFVMLGDEMFYDAKLARFTVESFLDHGVREFGGYDSLVLWHAYPRIGFDERDQFDFYRGMPGGLDGLRGVSRRCQARGVKVFLDYNPWDTGTRREGMTDLDALAALVQAIEADGIFLDTMSRGAPEFRAKLDAVRPGVILEGEISLPLENIQDHHCSWAQEFQDGAVPGVLRNKWFERRHLQHQIKRWERDHTGELHCAWMNGSGMMVWENVFGSWVGWNPRDRSLLRAMLPVQRRYAAWFDGEGWTPLVPTQSQEVFASLWERGEVRLWTLVNRSAQACRGTLIQVPDRTGDRYFDLVRGREAESTTRDGTVALAGSIPPRGIGAFLAAKAQTLGQDFEEFLGRQARRQARASLDSGFPVRQVELSRPPPVVKPTTPPPGMAGVLAAAITMETEFQVRECGFYESTPTPGPNWGALHRLKRLTREVKLGPYAIDLTPVTNAQFAAFLDATRYRPRHRENFLRHWQNGAPPPGRADHPVVYVDLEDARNYAAWAGKRLPTEEEWQHAAQGPEQRFYPWGDEMRAGVCNDGTRGGTTPVTAFPDGRSPCGCFDMCGNVWHWTESERRDGRTRFCILKGGSWFRARGSAWYADGGPLPCRFAAKFLLMWSGLDRCSTIGFRCVVEGAA